MTLTTLLGHFALEIIEINEIFQLLKLNIDF